MNWLCLLLPQRQVSRRATFYDWGRDSFVIAMKKVDFSSLDVRLAWINSERSDWLSVSTIVYCIEMQTPLWLFEHELWPFDNFHSCHADTQTHFCTCFLLMCVLVIAVIVEIMYIVHTMLLKEGNGDLQTLICVLVARSRWCSTLSNPVPWQNWMADYLGYTLWMKTLFRGWPVMVHDTHTRRRRLKVISIVNCIC